MSKYNVAHHEILYLSLLFHVELKKSVKYHDCVNVNCEFILMKDANHTAVL